MSKGRVPPQVVRVLQKAKLREKARRRAEALAARRAAKAQAASPASPADDRAVLPDRLHVLDTGPGGDVAVELTRAGDGGSWTGAHPIPAAIDHPVSAPTPSPVTS
jgi:hypothetical protein